MLFYHNIHKYICNKPKREKGLSESMKIGFGNGIAIKLAQQAKPQRISANILVTGAENKATNEIRNSYRGFKIITKNAYEGILEKFKQYQEMAQVKAQNIRSTKDTSVFKKVSYNPKTGTVTKEVLSGPKQGRTSTYFKTFAEGKPVINKTVKDKDGNLIKMLKIKLDGPAAKKEITAFNPITPKNTAQTTQKAPL